MRSTPAKSTKKPAKTANKKPVPARKKKMADLKPQIRDTISETISFVIKGKLTPIKPIMMDNKLDLITKPCKRSQQCGKIVKKRKCKNPPKENLKKQISKVKPKQRNCKIQIKTAKKSLSPQTTKKCSEKILIGADPLSKEKENKSGTKKTVLKPERKIANKTADTKIIKKVVSKAKIKEISGALKTRATKPDHPKKVQELRKQARAKKLEDDIKKQQTIEMLLRQANKEITSGARPRVKKIKVKKQYSVQKVKKPPKQQQSKNKAKKTNRSESNASDDITLKELSERPIQNVQPTIEQTHVKVENEQVSEPPQKPILKRKVKTNTKMTIIKKRVLASKKLNRDEVCKTKLFGFWNGPKRHRVASLNALAKVHCLYENETRGNILDIIDTANIKKEHPKKEPTKKESKISIKKEVVKDEVSDEMDEIWNPDSPEPAPTRTLRSLPGLRAVGKHWEMHETSSSSEDSNSDSESGNESTTMAAIKKEEPSEQKSEDSDGSKKETRRRRNRNEVMMDLKDMVVRKRMASLNATAILAASYSVEKRATKSQKDTDDSSCDSGSSEEYFAASDNDVKEEDDKKEDDRKLIEVHTTPNKKVAVILNQDTDVTITGVYVNSTTRSTHHEGYCSIAGMQYRISATSHTQTAATAVATETLLQSSSSSAPDNVSSFVYMRKL